MFVYCEPCDRLTQFSYVTLCTLHFCIVWHCQCTFSITHTRLHILHYSLYITHFTLVCHWLMCELVWESTWVCSREWVYISVDVFIGACLCNYLKCASLYACHSLHECVLYNVQCTYIDNDIGWVCISEQVYMGVWVCNGAWNKHLS